MTSAVVQMHHETVKKALVSTEVDKDAVRDAYMQIRDDKNEINWSVFKYEGNQIVVASKGKSFEDFKKQFESDERAFAYIRLQTGDELSRRAKFMVVTWVGTEVSAIKRAKMSTDKALVKEILTNFAVEITIETAAELNEKTFKDELIKAGGANYGTGIRDGN